MNDFPQWKTVEKQINAWKSAYIHNNERGSYYVKFAMAGDQWDRAVVSGRETANKESITLNHAINALRQGKRQIKEIDFSLNIVPTSEEVQEDTAQSNAYRLLSDSLMLAKPIMLNNKLAADKMMEYGYSFLEVSFEAENDNTLNQIPVTRFHKDPSIAFWDMNASHPCKIDGMYAGIKKILTKRQLFEKYPSLKKSKSLKIDKKENVVCDYWYRKFEPCKYILLKTGSYKRKDLLTSSDNQNLMTKEDVRQYEALNDIPAEAMTLESEGYRSRIYFKRFLNNDVIEKDRLYPTKDLPIPYHPGLTFWHPEKGDYTSPFVEKLEGAQKLHNYIQSQIATQAKNCTGDKFLFGNEHVTTQAQKNYARDINTIEGGINFSGNISTIRREPSAQISESLIASSQLTRTEIDELSGARADTQQTQQQVLSGRALDKLSHTTDMLNVDIEEAHILFVDTVGKLISQMIPNLITEERTIVAKNKDGSGQLIVINQLLPTREIKNNVKDIFSNFSHEMIGGPSTTMEKENLIRYLSQFYTIDPTFFQDTKDIAMRCLNSQYAGELERRAAAKMDKNLIDYSQGMITQQDFQKAQETQQQQKQQQQIQMSHLDPQVQSAQALAAADHRKASAKEQDAVTNRIKVIQGMQNDQDKLKIAYANMLINAKGQENAHALGILQQQMSLNEQMIQSYRQLIGDMQPQMQENAGQSFPDQQNAGDAQNAAAQAEQ